jgi:hypothetical protein
MLVLLTPPLENVAAGPSAIGLGIPPASPIPSGRYNALCRLLERRTLPCPRREYAAAVMRGRLLDDVAALLQ